MYVGFVDPASTIPESEGLLPVAGGGPRIESRVIWTFYEQLEPMNVRYDSGLSLVGVALGQGESQLSTKELIELDLNRSIWVAMHWEDLVDSETAYATSLRLHAAEAGGSWVYQEDTNLWKPDGAPGGDQGPNTPIDSVVHLAFPPELPAGEYALRLVLYDADTLQTVVQDGTWEPELILARIWLN